jgi:hypothetical protein
MAGGCRQDTNPSVAHFGPQSGSSVQNDQAAQAQGQRQPWRAIDLAISGVYDVNGLLNRLMVGNPDHRCSRTLTKRFSVQNGRFDAIKFKIFPLSVVVHSAVSLSQKVSRRPSSSAFIGSIKTK